MRTFQINQDNLDINELSDLNQNKTVNNNYNYNNNLINEKQFIYSSDEGGIHDNSEEMNPQHQKKLVRKYTDIYDPRKNKKGFITKIKNDLFIIIESIII